MKTCSRCGALHINFAETCDLCDQESKLPPIGLEKIRLYFQQYYHRYYKRNRKRLLESSRIWQRNNKDKHRLHGHIRRAKKMQNGGIYTAEEIKSLFRGQKERCFYCGKSLYWIGYQDYHVDHKTPISRGGANDISNIALTCPSCNLKKGAMTEGEYKLFTKRNQVSS